MHTVDASNITEVYTKFAGSRCMFDRSGLERLLVKGFVDNIGVSVMTAGKSRRIKCQLDNQYTYPKTPMTNSTMWGDDQQQKIINRFS